MYGFSLTGHKELPPAWFQRHRDDQNWYEESLFETFATL